MKTPENFPYPTVLSNIDFEKVLKVYNGKQGCACGCRGNYSDATRTVKSTLTKMSKRFHWEENRFEVLKGLGAEYIVCLEGPDRANRLYTEQDLSAYLTPERY